MALNITYFTSYIIQELYVTVIKKEYFLKFKADLFEEESFLDWPAYIKLAVPTTLLQCIEWWAFEIVILMSGIISVNSLTA